MATGELSAQEEKAMKDAETALEEAERLITAFTEGSWARYAEKLKGISLQGDEVIIN